MNLEEAKAQHAALVERVAPLRAKREELLKKIQPLEAEFREVQKQLKVIEAPIAYAGLEGITFEEAIPLKKRKAELVAEGQPLENELREVNRAIARIERPALGVLENIIFQKGGSGVNLCCVEPDNLVVAGRKNVQNQAGAKGTVTVNQCKVCGKNHYVLEANPVEVGVKL